MITPRRLPPVDPGLLAEQLLALKEIHPGWRISYDSGIRVWIAIRSPLPGAREVAAGIKYMIRAASPERMGEKLTEQAELLKALPAPPPPPPIPRGLLLL
ncbi:hypothetical protein [Streptosporangium sp. NPDC051022]|uniref:hypothetical protein n=1 Tax=Streptosporangium sp. NPDC051022 TaxID=3155752 RepID=UPI00344963D3